MLQEHPFPGAQPANILNIAKQPVLLGFSRNWSSPDSDPLINLSNLVLGLMIFAAIMGPQEVAIAQQLFEVLNEHLLESIMPFEGELYRETAVPLHWHKRLASTVDGWI